MFIFVMTNPTLSSPYGLQLPVLGHRSIGQGPGVLGELEEPLHGYVGLLQTTFIYSGGFTLQNTNGIPCHNTCFLCSKRQNNLKYKIPQYHAAISQILSIYNVWWW